MRAVDTNVVVRILVRDSVRQVEAAEKFIEGGAWISLVVLAEVLWVLGSVYDRGPRELVDAVEMLLQHDHFVLQDAETVAATLELFRAKPALGFSDCLMLELARRAGHLPLGTFDHALGRLAGAQKL